MSRQLEFIRGKSVYTEFKEGEIKKIKNRRVLRKGIEVIMEIGVDKDTIIKEFWLIRNYKRRIFYIFPKDLDLTEEELKNKKDVNKFIEHNKNERFLYNLLCLKENMAVSPICTPIECTTEELNQLEGLKIPFLVSHRLTEKGEEVEYIPLIEEGI